MAEETQYAGILGVGSLSTANSNLDGTGTLVLLNMNSNYASNGAIVKSITVKAAGNTTDGMVRLFINNATNYKLVTEIQIPAVTKSATDPAFGITVPVDFALAHGWQLYAATENAENFNVIAEGLGFEYYATSVRYESTNYTANTGQAKVSTANSNLDGTGTLVTVLTGGATTNSIGTIVKSVVIKAQQTTTTGMVRLFINDGTTSRLFLEVPVAAFTASGTAQSFSRRISFGGNGLILTTGYTLKASTEKGEAFSVISEGLDWLYPA